MNRPSLQFFNTLFEVVLLVYLLGMLISQFLFFVTINPLNLAFVIVIIFGIISIFINNLPAPPITQANTSVTQKYFIFALITVQQIIMFLRFLDLNIGIWFIGFWLFAGILLGLILLCLDKFSLFKLFPINTIDHPGLILFSLIIIGYYLTTQVINNDLLNGILAAIFMFFLPGYFWSGYIFGLKTISMIERVGVIFLISMIGLPIIFIYFSFFYTPININTIVIINLGFTLSGYLLYKRKIHQGIHAS